MRSNAAPAHTRHSLHRQVGRFRGARTTCRKHLHIPRASPTPASTAGEDEGGLRFITNVRDLSKNQVGCPYAQRVWLTLELKRARYTRVEVDLNAKPDWLLRMNPKGRVPCLVDPLAVGVVYESTIINEYLEERFPAPALLPEDPYARAVQRLLVARADSAFIPAGFRFLCFGQAHLPAWMDELRALDERLEAARGAEGQGCGGSFLGRGPVPGLADVTYMPFFERLDAALAAHRGLSVRETCAQDGLGSLAAWIEAMESTPEFKLTMSDPAAIAQVYEPSAVAKMSYLNQ